MFNDQGRWSPKICVQPNASDNSAIAWYHNYPTPTYVTPNYDQVCESFKLDFAHLLRSYFFTFKHLTSN